MLAYRIPKFHEAHTRNELTKLSKKGTPWPWVRVPTGMSSDGFRMLMATPGGVTAFGVYMLLVEIAANTPLIGLLANENGIMDARRLAVRIGAPASEIEQGLTILMDPVIGWIDQIQVEIVNGEIVTAECKPPADGLPNRTRTVRSTGETDAGPDADRLKSESDRPKPESDRPQTALDEDEDEEEDKELDEDEEGSQERSESEWRERTRSGGRQLWLVSGVKLSRSASGSAQWRADKTSVQRMYDEQIWTEDLDPATGNDRLRRATALAVKAAEIKPKPLAWLTTALKAELGPTGSGVDE